MYSKPCDPDPYWERRQRDPETNARMVCVFIVIDEVVYFYRFIERAGMLVLHSCQGEHQLDMGQRWITDPEEMRASVLRVGFTEALGKARRERDKWTEEEKSQTELKLEMERKAKFEVEHIAALEAASEAEKAMAEADRDRLNKERVKEQERNRSIATYIGIAGFCVFIAGFCVFMVGVFSISSGSILLGSLLVAGVGFTVAAVCLALIYTKSFDPQTYQLQQTAQPRPSYQPQQTAQPRPSYQPQQTTQPRQSYQPQQTTQPKRFKYTWEMSDDEKNAMLLGRLQNDYMHHKNK